MDIIGGAPVRALYALARASGRNILVTATFADRVRLAALAAGRLRRRAARAAKAPAHLVARLKTGKPDRLVIAPQDIRTADPTRAEDIYAGYFAFGGRIVNTQGRSPFDIHPPSLEWEQALAGFGWLRHLRAADTALARANARALVDDYLNARARLVSPLDRDVATIARRVLSWLSQSPIVLEGADAAFYRRFMKSLARDAARLQQAAPGAVGAPRLLAAIALAEYALCANLSERALARATAQLSNDIQTQILPDGGHVGRNPQTLVDLLLDLLPLRQAYAARSATTPQALVGAIDRMLPMVRLLRHGDGALGLFNGMSVTAPDRIATVLAYDDARGQPLMNAPHAGYQRLQAGDCVALVEAGAAPAPIYSSQAHAGCLSLEFSVGAERIIVNCGAPASGRAAVRLAARQTAAHSTLVLDDTSSCHIAPDAGIERVAAGQILAGPRQVTVVRKDGREGAMLDLSHDGYARRFGLIHERRVALDISGVRLVGEDRLSATRAGAQEQARSFALRFHLHPNVRLAAGANVAELRLETPAGRIFVFEAGGLPIEVEESVFFASPDGARATQQIVVRGPAQDGAQAFWSLTRAESLA